MRRIENRYVLAVIYAILTLYAVFSVIPFFWTTIQSFKTPRQANSRVPLFIFEPTTDNYTDLWLKSIPHDPLLVTLILLAIFGLLTMLAINARRFPVSRGYVYLAVLVAGFITLLLIPRFIRTETFYNYFLNTIIVTAGTICISISIGCLAGYGLARYSGLAGVIILVTALGFRSLPGLSYILPYWWFGQRSGLYDTHFLLIITLGRHQSALHHLDAAQLLHEHPQGDRRIGHGRWRQPPDRFHQRHHPDHVARHHLHRALYAPARL